MRFTSPWHAFALCLRCAWVEQVPAVKDLQQMLSRYQRANAQMQKLISQLCSTLAGGSAGSQIAERLRSLAITQSLDADGVE